MTTIEVAKVGALLPVLEAHGRAPEIPEAADAYGWLVGSWELDVYRYWGKDVSAHRIKGEAHFGWVLEGRAVQDVWIMPRRSDRTANLDKTMNMYGATLRVWDPSIQAWRITWRNPAGDHHEDQIAAAAATTWFRSARVPMARPPAGPSRKSRSIRSIGSGKPWKRMAKRGSSKANSALHGRDSPGFSRQKEFQ
jgi:hypothetical protein